MSLRLGLDLDLGMSASATGTGGPSPKGISPLSAMSLGAGLPVDLSSPLGFGAAQRRKKLSDFRAAAGEGRRPASDLEASPESLAKAMVGVMGEVANAMDGFFEDKAPASDSARCGSLGKTYPLKQRDVELSRMARLEQQLSELAKPGSTRSPAALCPSAWDAEDPSSLRPHLARTMMAPAAEKRVSALEDELSTAEREATLAEARRRELATQNRMLGRQHNADLARIEQLEKQLEEMQGVSSEDTGPTAEYIMELETRCAKLERERNRMLHDVRELADMGLQSGRQGAEVKALTEEIAELRASSLEELLEKDEEFKSLEKSSRTLQSSNRSLRVQIRDCEEQQLAMKSELEEQSSMNSAAKGDRVASQWHALGARLLQIEEARTAGARRILELEGDLSTARRYVEETSSQARGLGDEASGLRTRCAELEQALSTAAGERAEERRRSAALKAGMLDGEAEAEARAQREQALRGELVVAHQSVDQLAQASLRNEQLEQELAEFEESGRRQMASLQFQESALARQQGELHSELSLSGLRLEALGKEKARTEAALGGLESKRIEAEATAFRERELRAELQGKLAAEVALRSEREREQTHKTEERDSLERQLLAALNQASHPESGLAAQLSAFSTRLAQFEPKAIDQGDSEAEEARKVHAQELVDRIEKLRERCAAEQAEALSYSQVLPTITTASPTTVGALARAGAAAITRLAEALEQKKAALGEAPNCNDKLILQLQTFAAQLMQLDPADEGELDGADAIGQVEEGAGAAGLKAELAQAKGEAQEARDNLLYILTHMGDFLRNRFDRVQADLAESFKREEALGSTRFELEDMLREGMSSATSEDEAPQGSSDVIMGELEALVHNRSAKVPDTAPVAGARGRMPRELRDSMAMGVVCSLGKEEEAGRAEELVDRIEKLRERCVAEQAEALSYTQEEPEEPEEQLVKAAPAFPKDVGAAMGALLKQAKSELGSDEVPRGMPVSKNVKNAVGALFSQAKAELDADEVAPTPQAHGKVFHGIRGNMIGLPFGVEAQCDAEDEPEDDCLESTLKFADDYGCGAGAGWEAGGRDAPGEPEEWQATPRKGGKAYDAVPQQPYSCGTTSAAWDVNDGELLPPLANDGDRDRLALRAKIDRFQAVLDKCATP